MPATLIITSTGTLHAPTCKSAVTSSTARPLTIEALPYLKAGYKRCRSCLDQMTWVSDSVLIASMNTWNDARHAERRREWAAAEEARAAEQEARQAAQAAAAQAAVTQAMSSRERDIHRIRTSNVDDAVVLAIFEDVVDLLEGLSEGGNPIEWEPGEAELLIRGGCTLVDFQTGVDAAIKAGSYRKGPVWGYIRNTAIRRRVTLTADRRDG
jgi:hypothetical protein